MRLSDKSHWAWAAALAILILSGRESLASVYPWDIKSFQEVLHAVENSGTSTECQFPKQQSDLKVQCGQLSEDFCATLWAPENVGNMKVSDGAILFGSAPNNKIFHRLLESHKALVSAQSRLPADLRDHAGSLVTELKQALQSMEDTDDWYKKVGDIHTRWDAALKEVARRRTLRQNPELRNLTEYSAEQNALFVSDYKLLQDEVLDAKYANHPNWRRVQDVFAEAQNDLLKVIEGLKIPASQKNEMLSRVKTVRLSLPYQIKNDMQADRGCGLTKTEAFYSGLQKEHAITICAGYFNALQSKNALYHIIAHEISHSVDPRHLARHTIRKQGPFASRLKSLAGAKGPVFSCDTWEKLTEDAQNSLRAPGVPKNFENPTQPLLECLSQYPELKTTNHKVLLGITERETLAELDSKKTRESFQSLATPGDFYLRPDLVYASQTNGDVSDRSGDDPRQIEIFTQALACAKINQGNGTLAHKDAKTKSERERLLTIAEEQTAAVWQASRLEWYSYCGRNCPELDEYQLSKNKSENFADWMAIKALSHSLTREKNLRIRREATALAMIGLCTIPASEAGTNNASATRYGHSPTEIRRLSLYTEENAQLAACEISKNESLLSRCEL